MFFANLLQRRIIQGYGSLVPKRPFASDYKPDIFFFGGGLWKLQGGMKEVEYFKSVNQSLMSKLHEHLDKCKSAAYLQNWDEFKKTLDHQALYNTSCMNKHKNVLEESYFMTENADCIKAMQDRAKKERSSVSAKSTENGEEPTSGSAS
ncbi:uncharacterized protein Dwil_GK22916 [Drosophila willistoni]|uniref:Uncharacterized protein n=1 Tax=Drosophila willistoni TaxID=7260 RepID=B4NNB8_DROWI|nr:uncharacterized protein LOC6652175 [Drosophila willistoni]EDW85857.1 uncharacterized protein Dwil_GK22916 [Drosophila willistoni]